jgi:hypothetical protein
MKQMQEQLFAAQQAAAAHKAEAHQLQAKESYSEILASSS